MRMFDGMFSKNIQWETTGYMTLSNHQYYLVGGLEHFFIFPFSWEFHDPN